MHSQTSTDALYDQLRQQIMNLTQYCKRAPQMAVAQAPQQDGTVKVEIPAAGTSHETMSDYGRHGSLDALRFRAQAYGSKKPRRNRWGHCIPSHAIASGRGRCPLRTSVSYAGTGRLP